MIRPLVLPLLCCLLWALCPLTAARADNTRIEALDGGVVDLSGLTHIIGLGSGVDVVADGADSVVKLNNLQLMLDDADGLDSSLLALHQGLIELNANQPTELGSHVNITIDPSGRFGISTLVLGAGSVLNGQGTLAGNLVNGGLVSPNDEQSPFGHLIVTGQYKQTAQGRLNLDLAGSQPGSDFDLLTSAGNLELAGVFALTVLNDFVPYAGSQFNFLAADSRQGSFNYAYGLTLPTGGKLGLEYTAAGAALHAAGIGFQDQIGPALSSLQFNGAAFGNGSVISKAGNFTASVSDPSGVGRLDYILDGVLLGSARGGDFAQFFNPLPVADGPHSLSLLAYDTLNNITSLTLSFSVALAAPDAPLITQPVDGLLTNQKQQTVSGSAAPEASQVQLFLAGNAEGSLLPVQNGSFTGSVTLKEGENLLSAKALNRGGESPSSAVVKVKLDSKKPDAPVGLTATGREAGEIVLTWSQVNDQNVVGYDLYRAKQPFSADSEAVKVNSTLLNQARFNDLPTPDGTYYYRVQAVNSAGTASDLSNQAQAVADSVGPKAMSIVYHSDGAVDAVTGKMASGQVNVVVSVSEPLLTTPFLSLTPNKGVPTTVTLSRVNDTEYSGSFAITDKTPTGMAYAVFSARDKVGNRGTDIDSGATVEFDTDGPRVTLLKVTPQDPIKNDANAPVTLSIELALDEAPKADTTPSLEYLLSADGRSSESVTLTAVDATHWQASLSLPADAGLNGIETLRFSYQAEDDLGNLGETINGQSSFQVYQGELPPLDPPAGLTATALPAGRVQLQWQVVEAAADYAVYRQGPQDAELQLLSRSGNQLSLSDDTPADGVYRYAVATVRQTNAQESLSGLSDAVDVKADATPPTAPQQLALSLQAIGVAAQWQPVADDDTLRYRLYRAALPQIDSVAGLSPLQDKLVNPNTVDSQPSLTEHSYVVTAVDPAGNESEPSNSMYLNVNLLPVASLTVSQIDEQPPVISWSHPSNDIAGYDVYLGSGNRQLQLNQTGLLTQTQLEDTGYSGEDRLYQVIAQDNNGARSLGRSLLLPAVQIERANAQPIQRGIMNSLPFKVQNNSGQSIEHARVSVNLAGHAQQSAEFSLPAGASVVVPVVVGGYADLPDNSDLTLSVLIEPNAGEQVAIVRHSVAAVQDAGLALQLLTQDMVRGGNGKVRIALENTSAVELELVTATHTASAVSDQIRFKLIDADGNVLSTQAFKQALGEQVVTLPNGNTVARIPAGSRFDSEWFDLSIPGSAPDLISIVLEVDKLHYHLGQPDAISIGGLQARQAVTLIDTSYLGELTSVSPTHVMGSGEVVISGRALDRTNQAPLGLVPLQLVLSNAGFERRIDVFTNNSGEFSYTYKPQASESGLYRVSCIHPDLLERPEQGQFTVGRVSIDPTLIQLRMPRNADQVLNFNVATGLATNASNLRLQYLATDQTTGSLEPGIQVTLPAALNMTPEQTANLPVTVHPDATAYERGSLYLRLVSDETGSEPLAMLRINYVFSDAAPALFVNPTFVETGVIFDDNVIETVTLDNQGFADLQNVRISLLDSNGNPAPSWIYPMTASNLGNLAIGEQREVSLNVQPSNAVTEGLHEFTLRIESDNNAARDVPVYVSVSQAGLGNVLFHVADIYTATLDANGQPIQGLAGARIQVQKEDDVLLYDQTQSADAFGEALFKDLPTGRYKFRASAPNHQEIIGRFTIKPGITLPQEVFLEYNLVTVEWSVTEIALLDKYDITLNATYETDVPAAVVIVEPSGINLPRMQPGEVFYGEFSIINYGLIRADNIRVQLPGIDQYFAYQFMVEVPKTLEAKQRVTVPYRITGLRAFDPATDGAASGGGCHDYTTCVQVVYDYTCANGWVSSSRTGLCWYDRGGQCPVDTHPVKVYAGGPGGSGSPGSVGPGGDSIKGLTCQPGCSDGQCCVNPDAGGDGTGK